MKPRVAHFVPIWLPRTETFIYHVVRGHRRWEPFVLAQNLADTAALFPFSPVYSHAGLTSRWSRHAWYERWRHWTAGREWHPWESILERNRTRIVHAHFGHTGAEIVATTRRMGIPQVTSFYGWDDTVPLTDPSRRSSFDRLFAAPGPILVEGSHIASRLVAAGAHPERVRVHRIGIPLDRIPPTPSEAPPGRPVRLLFCGRFAPKKGLADAIAAVAMARDAGHHMVFRVLGDGPERAYVERAIERHGLEDVVTLEGPVTYEEYLRALLECDVFVQPSRTAPDGDTEGGAPTTLIEAQAAAKPILTTRHADIPEIVRNGESAVVVPEGDPESLGRGLLTLLNDPAEWAAMGLAGRRHVEAAHDIGRQMERLESLYDDVSQGVFPAGNAG